MNQKVYVVFGYDEDNGTPNTDIYGVFSTEELADECISYLMEELEYLICCYIEEVELDAFGHR